MSKYDAGVEFKNVVLDNSISAKDVFNEAWSRMNERQKTAIRGALATGMKGVFTGLVKEALNQPKVEEVPPGLKNYYEERRKRAKAWSKTNVPSF